MELETFNIHPSIQPPKWKRILREVVRTVQADLLQSIGLHALVRYPNLSHHCGCLGIEWL